MSVIPCARDARLKAEIERFAEVLKTQAHQLGDHGLSEQEFYSSAIFRGAIERVRGEFSATLRGKREFVQHVLNHLWDGRFIAGWEPAKGAARNDYSVRLVSGRTAVIDLKGCLDGNNTNIFERPADADEFVIWSLCTNVGADPRRNAWSGIHTRLSAEIIHRQQPVDGVIIWDMICGQIGRPCPKLAEATEPARRTAVGPFLAPPPCIYVLPREGLTAERPYGAAQPLEAVELLSAFHRAFGGRDEEVNFVDFEMGREGEEIVQRTVVRRDGAIQHASEMTPIRRV